MLAKTLRGGWFGLALVTLAWAAIIDRAPAQAQQQDQDQDQEQDYEPTPFGQPDRVSIEAVKSLEAYAAYKLGDYETARQRWLPLAEGGNTSAMINLANLYEQGQGVARDPVAAAAWLTKAAELDDPRAQVSLGLAYETGQGVARAPRTAAAWFRRAAEQGDTTAQFNLGVMLATAYGEGLAASTPEQRREAMAWLDRAVQGGEREAEDMLNLLRAAEDAPR